MNGAGNMEKNFSSFKRRMSIVVMFAALACIGFLLSIMKGSVEIPAEEIQQTLISGSAGVHAQILMNIRLPRTIVAALVGIHLSLSGAILQAIMKNPLADPHIIGISSGAGELRDACGVSRRHGGGCRDLPARMEERHPPDPHHLGGRRRLGFPRCGYFRPDDFLQ